MKTIKILSLIALFSIAFTACTSADEPVDPAAREAIIAANGNNNNNNGSTATGVVGTYKMTAFNTSVPTDLNGDGVSSTNQMNETICFNNSLMTLSAANTFLANSKGVEIDATVTPNVLTCSTDPDVIGTYTVNGNIITTTHIENGVSQNNNFTISGNTLIYTINNGAIVGTTSTGSPVTLTANITIIYTKQ